ncbi:MAG: hypothetical protein KC615_19980 [Anaerolineae bacterium]|nr:hypothetical protein [Anaerolineae bacterium]MCB9458531.1 hypothetical protein [Anaerolineaceae bacterium]
MPSKENMGPYFKRLLKVIECLYPTPPPKEKYLYLLCFLYEETQMTEREVAYIYGSYVGKDYLDLIGDVSEARTEFVPNLEKYGLLKQQLVDCGYGDWALDPTTYDPTLND